MPIFSLQVEKHALGGLIKNPQVFSDISNFISDTDFFHEVHSTIYSVIRATHEKQENIDKVILAQKIKNLGINFKDDLNIFNYIDGLCFTQITPDGTVKACQELKVLAIRRRLHDVGTKIQLATKNAGNKPIDEILSECDQIYSSEIQSYTHVSEPQNIFADLEDVVEEIGNNPPNPNEFLMGPFKTINNIYGSLLRPGAINLIGARTGGHKTSLGMYYLNWVAEQNNIPVLHLDFAEMSLKELQMRAVCMLTKGKVPFFAVENGDWRKNKEWERLVRAVWPRVKKMKMYYEDIGNMSPDEIISLIRRFYYKTVGRGNRFLIHYDYLKPFNFDPRTPEYKEMGHFIQKLKCLITNEIPASVWASLQLNRIGIVNNKTSEEVDDSENAFSISDRIVQQATHAFLIRPKLIDEIAIEHNEFGNMKAIPVKHRHLGKDFNSAIYPVKLPNGKFRKNYVNLLVESFHFEDKGDLNQMVEKLQMKAPLPINTKDKGDLL